MADEQNQGPEGSPAGTAPSREGDAADAPGYLALKAERDDLYDRLLRKTAEFDNYRKRVERERREQADQAVVDLLLELLLVVDDFDRALSIERRRRGIVPEGRRAHPLPSCTICSANRVCARSRRSVPTSIRTFTRPWPTSRARSIGRAKSSAKCGEAT